MSDERNMLRDYEFVFTRSSVNCLFSLPPSGRWQYFRAASLPHRYQGMLTRATMGGALFGHFFYDG